MLAATVKNAHTIQSGLREAQEATWRAASLISGAAGMKQPVEWQEHFEGRVRASDAPPRKVPFFPSLSPPNVPEYESDLDADIVADIPPGSVTSPGSGAVRRRRAPAHLVLDSHSAATNPAQVFGLEI